MADSGWKKDFRFKLEDFVDRFVVVGADRDEVLTGILATVEILRDDFQQDPDPAEDEISRDPEPSNDWPASERD
jgi:hypothetical protein